MTQPARTVTINGKELPWPTGCLYFSWLENDGEDIPVFDPAPGESDVGYWNILVIANRYTQKLPIIAAVAAEWCRHKSMVLENEANDTERFPVYYGPGNAEQNAVRSVIKKESKFWADAATAWRSVLVWPQPETKEPTPIKNETLYGGWHLCKACSRPVGNSETECPNCKEPTP